MFVRMIRGIFARQWKKMALIALTIALGASLATAMISVVLDVEDKVNQELKAYGANITVVPKQSSLVNELYDIEDHDKVGGPYLREDELGNIKTIFWAFNIVDYTPLLDVKGMVDNEEINIVGSWFNHHMELPTGETLNAGINSLRSWWDIKEGKWIDEQADGDSNVIMVGEKLAEENGYKLGDMLSIAGSSTESEYEIVGIFEAGGLEDHYIYMPLNKAQELSGLDGNIDSIEVSALTTPDNELAVRAAKDPDSLTIAQYETWYCTAYVSAICFQITEVITDSVASPVRQVADSEGSILDKTELLMILITILSLIGSTLGITNLVTASVMERSQEIGLMKAVGAKNGSITGIVLTEILCATILGAVIGFEIGIGFAQIIGISIFGTTIVIRGMVAPVVLVLILIVTFLGSVPAIRMLLKLEPAEVLHG